jgi:hypothetical protein
MIRTAAHWQRKCAHPALAVAALALVLLIAGCSGRSSSGEVGASQLTDLTSVNQSRGLFNGDDGRARLLLLLSPT